MSNLQELIARVEAASGPDREIDTAIREMFGIEKALTSYAPSQMYTGKIDAAASLVERMLPNACYDIKRRHRTLRGPSGGFTYLGYVADNSSEGATQEGRTPALALVAALLRALAGDAG